jgi:hypothetical protein
MNVSADPEMPAVTLEREKKSRQQTTVGRCRLGREILFAPKRPHVLL